MRLLKLCKEYMAVKSMTPVSLLLFLVQSVFLIELVEEEADRTRCESPVERFHFPAVPGEGKKRDWEPELWPGHPEPKPSLATGLLWAVNEAPHPSQGVISCARGHWLVGWVVVSAGRVWNTCIFNVCHLGLGKTTT